MLSSSETIITFCMKKGIADLFERFRRTKTTTNVKSLFPTRGLDCCFYHRNYHVLLKGIHYGISIKKNLPTSPPHYIYGRSQWQNYMHGVHISFR